MPSSRSSTAAPPGTRSSWRAELLGVEPVLADADVDLERRIELVGGAHLAPHQLGRAPHLPRRALEQQLVVDLQDQAGLPARLPPRPPATRPRHLYDVGRRGPDY